MQSLSQKCKNFLHPYPKFLHLITIDCAHSESSNVNEIHCYGRRLPAIKFKCCILGSWKFRSNNVLFGVQKVSYVCGNFLSAKKSSS